MKDDGKRCCICGKTYEGYGHNPWPVKESGRCCRECNYTVVLQARMENYMKTKWKKAMNKRVYISGAIAHHDISERKRAFAAAETELKKLGMEPVNPFRNGLPEDADWRQHMRVDIGLLLSCGYVYMLKGWELSKGAKLELDVASSCGIKVLFEM